MRNSRFFWKGDHHLRGSARIPSHLISSRCPSLSLFLLQTRCALQRLGGIVAYREFLSFPSSSDRSLHLRTNLLRFLSIFWPELQGSAVGCTGLRLLLLGISSHPVSMAMSELRYSFTACLIAKATSHLSCIKCFVSSLQLSGSVLLGVITLSG